jgi:hypothetical protein
VDKQQYCQVLAWSSVTLSRSDAGDRSLHQWDNSFRVIAVAVCGIGVAHSTSTIVMPGTRQEHVCRRNKNNFSSNNQRKKDNFHLNITVLILYQDGEMRISMLSLLVLSSLVTTASPS